MIHTSSLLDAHHTICRHGFFGLQSETGASQNAAFVQEEPFEEVRARRGQMVAQLGLPDKPVMSLKQIHSDKVVIVDADWEQGQAPEADGFVTQTPGIILGILTADCGPLLFLDPHSKIIGACHAGWKGALGGIIDNTLQTMESLGARQEKILAVLGPTIQQQTYEVGPEFPLNALKGPCFYSHFFKPSARLGHHMFDLPSYIRHRLIQGGISHFQDLQLDTFSGNFFSRRRSVSQHQAYDKKANLSAIALV